MAISRTQPPQRHCFEPDLANDGVRQALAWLRGVLATHVDAARITDAELIAEELLTNLARVARERGPVRVSMECALAAAEILLVFRDDAAPFDPLAQAAPRLTDDIHARSVGGLGIHLVREIANDVRYTREPGENVLEVRLNRKTEEA